MNTLHRQFKDFHVFKKFRELISSWWNIDVFLVEKTRSDFFLSEDMDLNNKVVKSLMDSNLFRSHFLQSLSSLSKEKDFKKISIKWRQTNFDILAVPLLLEGQLKGYIVATGFLKSKNLEILKQALGYLKFTKPEMDEPLSKLKSLTSSDQIYIKKFLSILAEESFSLIQEKERQEEIIKSFHANKSLQGYGSLIGKSPSMQFLYNILSKIKDHESPILIRGESGTGKTLLAKIIQNESRRSDKVFFIQSGSAFNDSLLKSELFGHKKEAVQGASQDKKGLLEIADGGTLFLDEVGDISLDIQSKLVRVLQDGVFFSVGDNTPKKSKVRFLAATQKNLEEMMAQGLFREDLFYRLNVISLKMTPLRERKEDIPLLVQHFLKEKAPLEKKQLSPKAMECLYNHSWPGNVRELANEMEQMLVLSDKNQDFFTEESLSKKIRFSTPTPSKKTSFEFGNQSLKEFLRSIEKEIILDALKQEKGNKTKVAKLLGSSRTSIILKTREYGLEDFEEKSS